MEEVLRKNLNLEKLILFSIIVVGFFLRILFLDQFPFGFHSQEAIVGYRAFSLANTARDELGRFLPLLFTSFKDYQLPFATYLVVPFVKFFGLNEFVARVPFTIFGTLSILAIYGIARKIFPERKSIALWSVLFLAVNPWAVFLSRTTSDIALSFHLFLIGFWALLFFDKKKWLLGLAFLALLASLYSSKVAWFFIPSFLAIFLFTRFSKDFFIQKMNLKLIFFIGLIFLWLPLLLTYLTTPSVKQSLLLNDFSFFTDISILNSVNQMRGETVGSGIPFLGKLFFNKSFYLIRFLENLLVHFNPRFLFAEGSMHPLLGLTNFGPILLVFLPAVIFGLVAFFVKSDKRLFLFTFWVFLAIVPSAFSFPSLNQERAIFLLPVVALLASLGLANTKWKWLLIFIVVLFFNFAFVIYDTVAKEPKRIQKDWLYGYEEVANFIKPASSTYDEIWVTNSYAQDPGPLLLFFLKAEPQNLWQSFENNNKFVFRSWIGRIDKIKIGQITPLPTEKRMKKIIFIATPEEIKSLSSYTLIGSVKDLNGDILLQVGRF